MCARCQSRPTMRMKDDTVRPVFGCNVKVKEDDSGPALISGKLVCAECRIAGTSCKWNGMGIVERYNRSRVLASGVEDKEEDDAGDLIPIPSTDDLGYKTSCEELAEASVELDCRSTSNSETASGSFLPAGTVGPLVLSGPVEQQKEYPRTQANTALSVVDVEPLVTAESIPPDPVHTSLRPTWNPRKTQIMWKPALELIRSTMRSLLRLDPIEYVLLERSRVVEHPDILNQQIGMLGTETNSLLAQLAVRVSAVSSMVIDSGANKEPEFTIPDGLGQGNLTKHFEVLIERWLRQETVTLKDDVKDVIDSIPWDLVKIQAFFASATHGL